MTESNALLHEYKERVSARLRTIDAETDEQAEINHEWARTMRQRIINAERAEAVAEKRKQQQAEQDAADMRPPAMPADFFRRAKKILDAERAARDVAGRRLVVRENLNTIRQLLGSAGVIRGKLEDKDHALFSSMLDYLISAKQSAESADTDMMDADALNQLDREFIKSRGRGGKKD